MRHIGSLIAGIVVAPLVWGLLAFGLGDAAALTAKWQADDAFSSIDLLEPLAFLAIAAVLFGLLATLRISPVGPLVAGAIYVLLTLSLFFVPLDVLSNIPDDYKITGRVFDLRAPLANGTLFVLGLALIMAVFSVSRWRRWPGEEPAEEVAAEEPTQTMGSAANEYIPAFSTTPSTSSESTAPLPSAPTASPPDLWGPAQTTYPGQPEARHARPGEEQTPR